MDSSSDKILFMKLKKKNEMWWEWHPVAPTSLPLYFQRLKLLSRQLMIHTLFNEEKIKTKQKQANET